MNNKILLLLNVKPHEATLVKKLFTIQFFLGVATAFLFTASLTLFISHYETTILPVSYVISAVLLLIFNRIYSHLEARMSSLKLLNTVILFCAASVLVLWLLLDFLPFRHLELLISAWYMLVYMLVGYAFWGMASILFNVRESKRLFSIVGAGDIPAKMLGYFSVSAVVPFIGIYNLLWISVGSFIVASLLLKRFKSQGYFTEPDHDAHDHEHKHPVHTHGIINKFFNNELILSIAVLSLISYVVFSLIDFTFLSDIKVKFRQESEIATFVGIFFAAGRLLAICIKLLFSSRMISRIGLSNSLLVTPVLLLVIDIFIIAFGNRFISHLYVFGFMVLLTEILRSALQEPVYFILFQPLKPHDRLRGHLIAKGYTLPFALLPVGLFLIIYFRSHDELPIVNAARVLSFFLVAWIITVFIIKNEYLKLLLATLKKGYFTGTELFLNDKAVINLLLKKTDSARAPEVIHSLNLLERSQYEDIHLLLLKNLNSPVDAIKEYALSRIVANNMTSALSIIKQQLKTSSNLRAKFIQASLFLDADAQTIPEEYKRVAGDKKAAMEGLLLKKELAADEEVLNELEKMASGSLQEKMGALEVMVVSSRSNYYNNLLLVLLKDNNKAVVEKTIEAAGKLKAAALLKDLTIVVEKVRAYGAFKRALIHFGDDIFSEENWPSLTVTPPILVSAIRTSGHIKGDLSEKFLVSHLAPSDTYAVTALWEKKIFLAEADKPVVLLWIEEKLELATTKVSYYYGIMEQRGFELLQQAVFTEIFRDFEALLKALALVYDKEKISRIIDLLKSTDAATASNALEVLELSVPRKYFLKLNEMAELVNDVQKHKPIVKRGNGLTAIQIIDGVLNDNNANFSQWTKSVTCYTLPKLNIAEVPEAVLNLKTSREDYLLNETKDYVLSMLK